MSRTITFRAVCRALVDSALSMGAEEACEAARTSGTQINMLKRALRVYQRAYDRASAYNLIGVGAISFAEARLEVWARRVGFRLSE